MIADPSLVLLCHCSLGENQRNCFLGLYLTTSKDLYDNELPACSGTWLFWGFISLIADAVFTVFVMGHLSLCRLCSVLTDDDQGDGSYGEDCPLKERNSYRYETWVVYERREVTLLFVVEFWCLPGDLTSEVEVYIPLFTCFLVVKGEEWKCWSFKFIVSGSVWQGMGTSTTTSTWDDV